MYFAEQAALAKPKILPTIQAICGRAKKNGCFTPISLGP
jgi:hypothetical protein